MNERNSRVGRRALILVACVVLAGATAPFSRAQNVRSITFDEAIRIALEQNVSLQRAANSVELQSVNVSSARANFLPDLTFTSSGGRDYGRTFNFDEGTIVDQTTSGFNVDFSSRINLFNGFGDVASLRQARLQRDASDLSYDRQRQTVVFSVMSNYLDLIDRREQIRIQEENLEAQRQLLAQIEEFVRVGSRPVSDLYQQQAAVANAELTVLEAERLYRLSEVSLIQTLQLDPFGNYEFEVPEVDSSDLVPQSYDPVTMLREAFEKRHDLRAQQVSIEAAQAGIRAARSNFWPSVNLSLNTESSYTDAAPLEFNDQFFDRNRRSSVGLSLSFPIFDRFATRNAVQRARVEFENARLDLESLEQDIALQVRQAYLDYLTDEKRLEVTEKQLRSAEQALAAAQERYNLGAATLVELTQARADYVQAQSDRAEAMYTFLFRKKLIEYYVGVLDPSRPLFR